MNISEGELLDRKIADPIRNEFKSGLEEYDIIG